MEDLKVSIAADRLISRVIAPGVEGLLNPSMSCQNMRRDVFVVTEQERYPISAGSRLE